MLLIHLFVCFEPIWFCPFLLPLGVCVEGGWAEGGRAAVCDCGIP